jgi:hypothetical protein
MKLFLLLAPLFFTKENEVENESCSFLTINQSSFSILSTSVDDKVTSTLDFRDDSSFTPILFNPTVTLPGTIDIIKTCFKKSTSTSTPTSAQTNDYKNSSSKVSEDDELFFTFFTFFMFFL